MKLEKRALILRCLVEGMGLRGTARATQTDVHTVQWFMEDLGAACLKFHDAQVREVPVTAIECDELHSYVHTKEEHLAPEMKGKEGLGSYYSWIAIDPDTKLIPSWHIGRREFSDAMTFIEDLASRVTGTIQLSTDGFKAYQPAIEESFGTEAHYGKLIKVFDDALSKVSAKQWLENRDQPPLKATKRIPVLGDPDPTKISTSIIERYNLTVRMSLRRFTRATNGASKKLANHKAMMAVFHTFYNYSRIHSSIRCTPAMEAKLTDHIWEPEELIQLLD